MALDILVVDDEQDIRDLVSGVLEDEGYSTRTAGSSSEALAALADRRPSLVLLDVWLQGSKLDGLQLLEEVKRRDPSLPVLMISGHGNLDTAVAAIRQGAVDFIEKPFDDAQLLSSIESALALASRRSGQQAMIEAAQRIATLSRRERQVLDGLMAGRANKAIASDLGLSVRTVEVHRARMLERLGTPSLAEAIRLAVIARLGPREAATAVSKRPSD